MAFESSGDDITKTLATSEIEIGDNVFSTTSDVVVISANQAQMSTSNTLFTKVSDGTNVLTVNGDGSLDVNVGNVDVNLTTSDNVVIYGEDSGIARAVKVDSAGVLAVQDDGGSLTIDNTNLDSPLSGIKLILEQLLETLQVLTQVLMLLLVPEQAMQHFLL